MKTTKQIAKIGVGLLLAASMWSIGLAQAAPVLNTNDFIGAPTNFNGFESIPNDGTFYTGGAGPYDEGGIRVTQINPSSPIWVTLGSMEGSYSWYPNGGDFGYTDIMRTDGADITNISLIFRSYGSGNVLYDILNDGGSVLTGELAAADGFSFLGRIGFQGGGFDQVRLRGGELGSGFYDGAQNALQIDSIKIGLVGVIPEPETYAMLLVGLLMLGVTAARRKQNSGLT